MKPLFFMAALAISWPVHAALVTTHSDTSETAPAVDGIISANEYGPGNAYSFTGGGSGFGGQLGPATMYMKSDANYLYIGFSNLGIPGNDDQYLVYFHSRPGGLQPNGIQMNDTSDGGRANVSRLSTDGTEYVSFFDGATNAPDFALLFNNRAAGFYILFDLMGAGTNHLAVPCAASSLGFNQIEFRVALSYLSITNGGVVDFTALEISQTGYLSNEGLPNPNFGDNPGFNNGNTTTYFDFHRFVTLDFNRYSGITQRLPNETLNFPQTIPPPVTNSYITTNAFPGLPLNNPIALATAPGDTNRLYVVERSGTIVVITNLVSPNRTMFMTLPGVSTAGEGGMLGLAFHPDYASNRYFFVFYTCFAANGTGTGFHTRISRFQHSATNINLALPSTEVVLFSQFNDAENHKGGTIEFGADGYLYFGSGDEGVGGDALNNSQFIDKDFFAGMLRFDVDKKPGSLAPNHHDALGGVTNYAIPPDNPFIGVTNYYGSNVVPDRVRTEFFATGLRNPFRFSFDRVTGLLYVGDVGQGLWEEINLVTNGGNYGWSVREGFNAGFKSGLNATNYVDPILVYGHGSATNQGFSVTGGRVYRGNRFPELVGKYIFCDYSSGHIWSLTHDGVTNTSFAWLANDNDIAGFGENPSDGELLMCDLVANQIKRLEYAAPGINALPATLSEAGIFSDLTTLATYEGIVPYTINVPFWSDGARKYRWFSLPNTNLQFGFNATGSWTAPTTTVWIKHFDLLLTSGVPSSVRRLETRVLVKNDTPEGGYGVTYRWGSSFSNAVLVPANGLDEELNINDSGVIRTQVWRYPSRNECLICHKTSAGFALSFNTPQMNTTHDFGDLITNQVAALQHAGYFNSPVTNIHLLRKLAHPTNTDFSVAYRVRSYLQANCVQCHIPGGPTPAQFDTRIFTPLSHAGLIDGALADYAGNTNNRVIVRGSTTHSRLLNKINIRGPGQMPPLATSVLDTQNIALVTAWINGEAAAYETFTEWQVRHFGSSGAPDAQPDQDPDDDGNINEFEYISGTQPTNALDVWDFSEIDVDGLTPTVVFERPAGAFVEVQIATNLINGAWFTPDIPENAPVVSATPTMITVPDPDGTNLAERFYRVRMFEP